MKAGAPRRTHVSSFKKEDRKRAEASAPTRLARCIPALIGPKRGLGPLMVGQLLETCAKGFWN